MKRKWFFSILCLLFAVLLLLGCTTPPSSQSTVSSSSPGETPPVKSSRFTDVSPDDWFYSSVMWAVDSGYFSGTSSTTFHPGEPMNRAMFVTVLANGESISPKLYQNTRFSDVEPDSWYAAPVEWAATWGLATGTGTGEFSFEPLSLETFSSTAPINRQDGAVILYNYLRKLGVDCTFQKGAVDQFSDAGEIASYAEKALDWAVTSGVMKGDQGKLRPQGTLTRAETAALFQNFASTLPEGAALPQCPVKPVPDSAYEIQQQAYTYQVPQIELEGVDTQAVNEAINGTYFDTLNWIQKNFTSGIAPVCWEIGYYTSISDEVLSIVTYSRTNELDSISFQVFNVDMTTGQQLDSAALLERAGYTPEQYQQAARNALEKAFDKYVSFWETSVGGDPDPDGTLRNWTLDPESASSDLSTPIDYNLENSQLHLDSSGRLWFIGCVFHAAGSQRRYVALPLEF